MLCCRLPLAPLQDSNGQSASTPSGETALQELQRTRRARRNPLAFDRLKPPCRKDLYDRAAQRVLDCCGSPEVASYLEAAEQVAHEFNINIRPCDRAAIKQSIFNRVQASRHFQSVVSSLQNQPGDVENCTPSPAEKPSSWSAPGRRGAKRYGRCGRKKVLDAALPSDKGKKAFKGAATHQEYQELVKSAAREAGSSILDRGVSVNAAAKAMQAALRAQGVTLSHSACMIWAKKARDNGCTNLTPQKPGGVLVADSIEKMIANSVRAMREMKFPVFPEDVKAWCAKEIEGTQYAQNFPDGKPSDGWYRGFLRRQHFLTGTLRPLEMTRAEWWTEENLACYYEIAEGVLRKAGVAEINQDYDPHVPYSEPLIITHPERILSYDETKVELDCTKGGKGGSDRVVRAGPGDDGETVVTKTGKCASAACGRTGDGRTLPPYIVFNSGEGFEKEWAPCIEEPTILDKDNKPLQWRYDSNDKGSMKEVNVVDYFESVLHPAAGYPPPRDKEPGKQGVVVCDGVGTHTGLAVLKRAVELGLEVLLRVPNLSFVLQGEDTVNFKTVKVRLVSGCIGVCLGR